MFCVCVLGNSGVRVSGDFHGGMFHEDHSLWSLHAPGGIPAQRMEFARFRHRHHRVSLFRTTYCQITEGYPFDIPQADNDPLRVSNLCLAQSIQISW